MRLFEALSLHTQRSMVSRSMLWLLHAQEVWRRHSPDLPLGGVHRLLQLISVLICHIPPERLHYLHVPALQPSKESCDSRLLQQHQTTLAFARHPYNRHSMRNTDDTDTVPFPLYPINNIELAP